MNKRRWIAFSIFFGTLIAAIIYWTLFYPPRSPGQVSYNMSGQTNPGTPMLDRSSLVYDTSIEIRPGETKTFYATLQTRKDGPGDFSANVIGTDNLYSENTVSVPAGLAISVAPSQFKADHNNTYRFAITIMTTPSLAKGEYWLRLEGTFANVFQHKGWIIVKVV